LSGLVFVAVSMNLARILQHPSLPSRAWQSMALLASPMFIGFFLLVPAQPRSALALELIVSSVVLIGYRLAVDRRAVRSEKRSPLPVVGRLGRLVGEIFPGLLSYLCLAVAGTTLLAQGGGGLYWLVPSVLLACFFGLMTAWALLLDLRLASS